MSIFNYDNFLLLWIAIMGVISSGTHIEVKENVLGNEVERYNLVFALIVFAPIFLLASVGEVRYDVWQYLVNFDNAESELEQLQQKFPEKQFRITTMSKEDAREAWWNKGFLD